MEPISDIIDVKSQEVKTRKPRGLSVKRRKYARKVVELGSKTEAVKDVFHTSTQNSTASMINKLNADELVQVEIEMAMRELGVNAKYIIEGHKNLAENSENDMVKTKNLEDLGQLYGMYPKAGKAKVEIDKDGLKVEWGGDE